MSSENAESKESLVSKRPPKAKESDNVTPIESPFPASEQPKPQKRLPLVIRLLLIVGLVAMLLACGAFTFVAMMPASAIDQRPVFIAALFTATPTSTPTSTATNTATVTSSPTVTFTPSVVSTSTITLTPSTTPSPTPTNTPTPQPTPDSLEREFYIPILMYHYISTPPEDADVYRKDLSVSPEKFQEQMEWLKSSGYTPITLYQLVYALQIGKPPLPERPIILTFDDGYIDNYENAYPILKELGFTATFFILTDVTDRAQPGYMTWDMIKELHTTGMSIEVHGREHLEMSGRDTAWLTFHLLGPAQTIEANLGYKPRFIAYPSGKWDDLAIQTAHDLDFWGAVTTQNGAHHTKNNLFTLERIRIRGDWNLDTFISVITAYY